MKKTILYLDQNFASNLAKVESLPGWKDPEREYYEGLLALLRSLVAQDRLACPTSYFHREESERGKRVREFNWQVVEELSHGLSFKSYTTSWAQMASAAHAYCGTPEQAVPSWALAFSQDPQQSVGPERSSPRILVYLESPEELIEYGENALGLVAEEYHKFKACRRGKSESFAEELQFLKCQLLRETFLPPQSLTQAYPSLSDEVGLIGSTTMAQSQWQILRIVRDSPNPEGFWSSSELLQCPFLDIRASLMAADIFFYPDTIPTKSLNTDFDIVASVMPYVDILATDGYIAELIRHAKLSQRFGASVFSMRQRHQLLEVLENL